MRRLFILGEETLHNLAQGKTRDPPDLDRMDAAHQDIIEVVVIPDSPILVDSTTEEGESRGVKRAHTGAQAQPSAQTQGKPTSYYHEVLIQYSHKLGVFVGEKARKWGFVGLNFEDFVVAFRQGLAGEKVAV